MQLHHHREALPGLQGEDLIERQEDFDLVCRVTIAEQGFVLRLPWGERIAKV